MLAVQLMSVQGGQAPRKLVWTETTLILVCTSNLRLAALPNAGTSEVDTSTEHLELAGHQGGAKFRCTQCLRLKKQEDKWIAYLEIFMEKMVLIQEIR